MWTDANPMLNLSSFVTTFMEPEARELMQEHVHINYVDHDMYPKTYAMEQTMVNSFNEVYRASKKHEVSLRTAAYILAIDRVASVYRLRGIFA